MDWVSWLSIAANIAQALTGVLAAIAAILIWSQKGIRRRRFEGYLEKAKLNDAGVRRIPHLMAHCYMTEAQIFEAALGSKKIKAWVGCDEDGIEGEKVLFSFDKRAFKSN